MITVEMGKTQIAYTPTFPARRYTYRHDVVKRDGVRIGCVQVRARNGRTDVLTTHDASGSCVIGRNVDWLERQP